MSIAGVLDGRRVYLSYPDFEDLRREARAFEAMSALVNQSVNLTGREEPTRVVGGFVSATFFDVIGVRPDRGRGFLPGEDEPGAERVCVVDHGAWRRGAAPPAMRSGLGRGARSTSPTTATSRPWHPAPARPRLQHRRQVRGPAGGGRQPTGGRAAVGR